MRQVSQAIWGSRACCIWGSRACRICVPHPLCQRIGINPVFSNFLERLKPKMFTSNMFSSNYMLQNIAITIFNSISITKFVCNMSKTSGQHLHSTAPTQHSTHTAQHPSSTAPTQHSTHTRIVLKP